MSLRRGNNEFKIYSVDSSNITLNLPCFIDNQTFYKYSNDTTTSMSFKEIDGRTLRVEFSNSSGIIDSLDIKGRFGGGMFITNTRGTIPFFTGILNVVSVEKSRFTIASDGSLFVDYANNGVLLLILFPFRGAGGDAQGIVYKSN